MGFYDVDYNNASDGQVTPGFYEVFVSDYSIGKATTTGNTVVNLFYKVRDDIIQPHQGAQIQYDAFVETPNAKWRFDTAAKAAGIPNGTPIQSAQDWAMMMINKDVRVKIAMSSPNQQGNTYPEVKSYYPTELPNQGRPMPVLVKAMEQQQRQQNVHSAAQTIINNGYQQPGNVQPAGYQAQQQGMQQPQQGSAQQQSLPGTDPMANTWQGAPLTDADLPF